VINGSWNLFIVWQETATKIETALSLKTEHKAGKSAGIFPFYAREVSYGVAPSDTSTDNEISDHMYVEDKSITFSCTGRSVGGNIKSPKLLGVGTGDFAGFTGIKGSPYIAASSQ
jgi:hypothetical protein